MREKITLTKKIFLIFMIIFMNFSQIFAEPNSKNTEADFVKGNIQDKISCVKNATGDDSSKISLIAVDFVLKNLALLRDDRDLAGLAIASVLAFPEYEFINNPVQTTKNFETIFYNFADKNVKISILEKILSLSKISKNENVIEFVNHFLQSSEEDKIVPSEIEKKAISILQEIGNQKSFEILYSIYKNKNWTSIENELKNAVLVLGENSAEKIFEIIKSANFEELKQIYSIFIENSEISSTLKSEIAENLLTNSMIIVRDASTISKEISIFQMNNCKILFENNWTRSSDLMISYFEVAKSEFYAEFLTDVEFSNIIKYIEKLASKNAVKIYVSYLEALNREMNDGNLPAVNVVSALIQVLGALGDKSAFDCLLFTTYLNYPEEIVSQARNALSSLKW